MMLGREAFPFKIATFHRGHSFILCALYVSIRHIICYKIPDHITFSVYPGSGKMPNVPKSCPPFGPMQWWHRGGWWHRSIWHLEQASNQDPLRREKGAGAERSNLLVWSTIGFFNNVSAFGTGNSRPLLRTQTNTWVKASLDMDLFVESIEVDLAFFRCKNWWGEIDVSASNCEGFMDQSVGRNSEYLRFNEFWWIKTMTSMTLFRFHLLLRCLERWFSFVEGWFSGSMLVFCKFQVALFILLFFSFTFVPCYPEDGYRGDVATSLGALCRSPVPGQPFKKKHLFWR